MEKRGQLRFEVQISMWACLPATICYLQKVKQHLRWHDWSDVRHGINYSLIVNATCFLEGFFESGLADLKEKKAKSLPPEHTLSSALQKKLRNRVGLDHYDGMFEYLTGCGFAKMTEVQPYCEGLDALFDMRNVLAHGREATFSWAGKSGETTVACSPSTLEPGGTYQKVHDYLIRRKLLSAEDARGITPHNFFKDEIAEHFVVLTLNAMSAAMHSLRKEDLQIFEKATGAPVENLTRLCQEFQEPLPGNSAFSTVTRVFSSSPPTKHQ